MRITIHRGTHEIGGTCVELATAKSRILIDFGMPLVNTHQEPFDPKTLIDKSIEDLKKLKILPDIKGLYKGEARAIDAILISHSHMDHYGLLGYVHPDIPIYMSEGAKELIEISDIFIPHKIGKINAQVIDKKKKLSIGDFVVTSYLVDHSAFDALAFLIEADGKRLFYSGDFRAHGRKSQLFEQMIRKPPTKIDCLLMEGSMLGRSGQIYKDEVAVQEGIEDILKNKSNIAFFFASAQNIDRMVSAYKACLKTNSILVIDLYMAFIFHKLGKISKHLPQFDWPNVQVYFFHSHAERLVEAGHKDLLYLFNTRKIKGAEVNAQKQKVLMLARDNSLFPLIVKEIKNIKGATIIYSMWDGYLTEKFEERCAQQGIEIKKLHTSGHATLDDLKVF